MRNCREYARLLFFGASIELPYSSMARLSAPCRLNFAPAMLTERGQKLLPLRSILWAT